MARNSKLRLTENDRAEYKRLQSNINAKIRRTKTKFNIDLSEHKAPTLESFTSRKQFNTWKNEARNFTSRSNQKYQYVKNKYRLVTTKQQLSKLERETNRAIRLAKQKQKETYNKLKDKPFIIGGEQRGRISDKMRTMTVEEITGISIPRPFNFDVFQSQAQLNQRMISTTSRSTPDYYDKKAETLKQNFITTISNGFNSDGADVVEMLKNIDADDFIELSIMLDEFDINTYDSGNEGGLNDEDRLETLRSYLIDFNEGSIKTDLKIF